jgi:hypothetical protein
MQVDLRLDPILATSQLTQDTVLHAIPSEDQLLAARQLRVAHVGVEAFLEHRVPICTGKARTWGWPRNPGKRNLLCEWLDVAHRFAEEVGIVLVGLRAHATSAK